MAVKFQLTDKELNELFTKDILKHIKTTIKDSNLEYWVRKKVHELLAENVVSDIIEKYFTEGQVKKILKESIKQYVDDKYED